MALLRRLLGTLATLVLLSLLCLALLRAAPGGPFDQEKLAAPEVQAALAERYRLDQSWWQQSLDYLSHALRGDLGPSFHYPDFAVHELIAAALPITLGLGSLALLLALAAAIGVAATVASGGSAWGDRLLAMACLGLMALPKFVLAPLLILLFALGLKWLPAGGWDPADPRHYVLPVLTLALPQFALLLRALHQSLEAALHSAPVRAALARGLSRRRVVWRHALPLALSQSSGYLGPVAIALLTGSAVVEQVYGLPGLGRYLVQAALNRDYTLVLGVVLTVALIVSVVQLIVELLLRWIDPRVRG